MLARLEPTSSVIANGLSIVAHAPPCSPRRSPRLGRLAEQAEAADVAIRASLDAGDHLAAQLGLEQVREALLRAQVLLDGHLPADLRDAVRSPSRASNTGKMPDSFAKRAILIVSFEALPQPSGQGTNTCR